MEHGHCKKEIKRLHDALEDERTDKSRLLSKKNAEVSYFKSELESLLSEMQSSFVNRQKRGTGKY